MDGVRFDRLARTVIQSGSRRALLGGVLGLAMAGGSRVRALANPAKQLAPPTCGSSGDVCTMLVGCCDGLTCVTSAINTNYGVCVAGEGGTVSIGTTLISPFSENVEQEVAAIAASETSSTTTTTTTQSEQEARQTEIKARKDARQSKQKTRRTTQKTEQQGRRDDRQDARELRRGPKLRLILSQPGTENETVRVTNQDDESVVLDGIASFLSPANDFSFGTPHVLGVGDSILFLSGAAIAAIEGNKLRWNTRKVCATVGDGFVLTAGFSSNSDSYEYVVLCDGSEQPGSAEKPRRKKRKKNSGKNKN